MAVTDPNGTFVSAGGLPTRITQPAPGPLTRAADVQARVARSLTSLRQEIDSISAQIERHGTGQNARSQHVTAEALRSLIERLAQVTALLSELEFAANSARSTIDQLRAERGHLQALSVIAEHLNSTLDRPTLMARMLDDLLVLVHGDRAGILLQDYHGQLKLEAVSQRRQQPLTPGDSSICRAAAEQSWRLQQPLLVPNTAAEALTCNETAVKQQAISSIMCSPLTTQHKTGGIVYVDRRDEERAFTNDEIDLLAAFCNLAAIAIENVGMFATQQLQMQAIGAMKNYTDSVLASIASGVIALDNQGRITRANAAAARILNIQETEVIGRPYLVSLQTIVNREIVDQIVATIEQPKVRETFFAETLIIGQADPLQLNISWSALLGTEQQRLGTVIVIDDLTELAAERATARRVERYVHPNVIELIKQHPSAAILGGSTREISIIFADLRDFTKLGSELSPAPLFDLLNEYLNMLTEIVFTEGGTVTMFQGDAIMAIFNAPADQRDHPMHAARAAWAMRGALEQQQARTGHRPVHFGIGVNLGPAYVGNIGHQRIQNYTAIGDAINTAKRIEEKARENRVLLSDAIYQRIADTVLVAQFDPVVVKGKTDPLAVWELRGLR